VEVKVLIQIEDGWRHPTPVGEDANASLPSQCRLAMLRAIKEMRTDLWKTYPSTKDCRAISYVPTKRPTAFGPSLFKVFCPSHLYEGIEGDLLEAFDADVALVGARMARRRFVYQASGFSDRVLF